MSVHLLLVQYSVPGLLRAWLSLNPNTHPDMAHHTVTLSSIYYQDTLNTFISFVLADAMVSPPSVCLMQDFSGVAVPMRQYATGWFFVRRSTNLIFHQDGLKATIKRITLTHHSELNYYQA